MYCDDDQRDFARRLRNIPTGAEKQLWFFLRAAQLDRHKFRRQAALGPYVVAFICFARRLVVELDGPQHFEEAAAEHDARRTAWLSARGYRVIRFQNHEVDEDVRLVVIDSAGAHSGKLCSAASPSPTLPSRGREPDRDRGEAAR
jgi:very-short-patch-repair endonuclease